MVLILSRVGLTLARRDWTEIAIKDGGKAKKEGCRRWIKESLKCAELHERVFF